MKRIITTTTLPASLESASQIRRILDSAFALCATSKKLHNTILLCVSEILTNCVEHSHDIEMINCQFFSNRFGWWIEVNDDGSDLDINNLKTKLKKENIPSVFNLNDESGRGLHLIAHLAERIELENLNNGHIKNSYYSHDETTDASLLIDDSDSRRQWTNTLRLGWAYTTNDKKPSILLVDDDPALLQLYQIYLTGDYDIYSAQNGEKALAFLQKQDVDLVVSDINMPHMNGIELRNALNEQKMELMPFIFLSTADDPHLIRNANSLGIDDYLSKPISKSNLLQAIERVLMRSKHLIARIGERIDKSITSALVPQLPKSLPHWDLRMGSRNTGLGGGDLFLYYEGQDNNNPGGELAPASTASTVVVVDIMGHNEASKFFSYAYGGYIKGLLLAHKGKISPSQLLETLSHHIYNDSFLGETTLTCVVIELKPQGEMTIACAGHPAPLSLTCGLCTPLPVSGMLAGLLPNTTYQSLPYTLKPGERLAIYTDGLFEAVTSQEGRECLQHTILEKLSHSHNSSIDQALDDVFTEFDKQSHQKPTDDALLMLLEPKKY